MIKQLYQTLCKILIKSVLFVFLFLMSLDMDAQCSGGGNGGALAAPTTSYQTMSVTTPNYYTFTVAAGCYPSYDFSFCAADGGSASFDSQITILDNTGAYAGGYNDDFCGLQSHLTWTPVAAGTYRVLVNTWNCTGTVNTGTLAYKASFVCCNQTLELYDTYGDGWNGGTVDLYVNAVLIGNYTLAAGYGPNTITFSAGAGQAIQVTLAAAGSWPNEMYYNVKDGSGATLVSNWYPNTSGTWNGTAACVACVTTKPGLATTPSPADGATAVNPCTVIHSWTAPVNTGCNAATSYDLYLGTSPTPPFFKNVTVPTMDAPSALLDNTLYYWKVVPKNAAGATVGAVVTWTFTTGVTANGCYCFTGNSSNSPGYGTNCVTVTPELNGQLGCIWNRGTISFASAFDYSLNVYFGNNISGADGCAFVFQNSPQGVTACGNPGGELGAGGIANAVVIEFDTYDNDFPTHTYDMSLDHTAIEIDGTLNSGVPFAGPVQALASGGNLDDGATHLLRVTWNPATTTLVVYIDGSQRLSKVYDFVTNVFGGNPNVNWGFTGATGGLNNLQYFCPINMPLPIELADFSVNCSKSQVEVKWTTASEVDNNYFTIERTIDGVNFEPLATIDAVGTSSQANNYSWVDKNPIRGNAYYRLRQTDNNGNSKTFNIVSVTCDEQTGDALEITDASINSTLLSFNFSTSFQGIHLIKMYDAFGNLLESEEKFFLNGNNTESFDVSRYAAGIYLINIENNSKTVFRKVMVVK